jgi:benzoate-CoA ligase family protein
MSPPKSPFNLYDYFFDDSRIERLGDRTAIELGKSRLTYRNLAKLTDRWALRFVESGIAEGDRVALLLLDSPEFIACFLGAAFIGAIAVPINTFSTSEEIRFVLSDSGAKLLVVDSDLSAKIDESVSSICPAIVVDRSGENYDVAGLEAQQRPPKAETAPETPCFLLYTSGSTGQPKGALHLHRAIPQTVNGYSDDVLRLTPDDRIYSSSRLFFAYGLGNSFSFPLAAGALVVLEPERPTPKLIADLFASRKPTVFFGVPAVYNALLESGSTTGQLDTSSIRLCISAGEALPARVYEAWLQRTGLEILDGIGSTEMLHIFMSNRTGMARAGSTGKSVRGYEVELRGDDGRSRSSSEEGNLWVRGASAFAGYWNRPDLTEMTIANGWVRTGDLYRKDSEGFYYQVGRSDDCFKVRGLWVSPIEVEAALLAHPAVLEAAVVPAVDSAGLATARAFVVIRSENPHPHEGLKDEIRATAATKLPPYKVPSRIEFIAEMPRTSTGKVQRYRLRSVPAE